MATIVTAASKLLGYWGLPGSQAELRVKPEGASQTFKKGHFLVASAGNLIIHAAANDANIVGIAAEAGKNNATAGAVNTQFYPVVPGLLLEMNLLGAASAARVASAADLWTAVQYQKTGADNLETLDATTTTPRFLIVDIGMDADRGLATDTNPRVLCVPLGTFISANR